MQIALHNPVDDSAREHHGAQALVGPDDIQHCTRGQQLLHRRRNEGARIASGSHHLTVDTNHGAGRLAKAQLELLNSIGQPTVPDGFGEAAGDPLRRQQWRVQCQRQHLVVIEFAHNIAGRGCVGARRIAAS